MCSVPQLIHQILKGEHMQCFCLVFLLPFGEGVEVHGSKSLTFFLKTKKKEEARVRKKEHRIIYYL